MIKNMDEQVRLMPIQTQIKDHMHWSDAVRSGLLFCGVCGEQIEQGCCMNSDGEIMCDNCGEGK